MNALAPWPGRLLAWLALALAGVALTLAALAEKGLIPRETVAKAIADLGVNPSKVFPELALPL